MNKQYIPEWATHIPYPSLMADIVMILHALIVLFVIVALPLTIIGGIQRWRWIRNTWFRLTHLVIILVVVIQALSGRYCPLTYVEQDLRLAAGQTSYDTSFVDQWVSRLIYFDLPAWVFMLTYVLFCLAVMYTWWRWPPRVVGYRRKFESRLYMKHNETYPIGTPGKPWDEADLNAWLTRQRVRRSYEKDVLSAIDGLRDDFTVETYGTLPYASLVGRDYPLYLVKSRKWDVNKPILVVTGGVHGYETSGVHGAIRFLQTKAKAYESSVNVLVFPCISPWGYETINRWNPLAVDPNRSFLPEAPAQEAGLAMAALAKIEGDVLMHIDLHETTDTDNSEFRPALAAREGTVNTNWNIPDGFYLVGDSERPTLDFQKAILKSVRKVTHIAEADERNELIGAPIDYPGLIHYAGKRHGLCMGLTDAPYVSTTEVYPDSAQATPEECVEAQVAAVVGGIDFALNARS
ncbi:DUF2784 family protein [Aliidiomarina halalkaliphila]|uniref:DUF2784 family protein n=2 Tax=Aliidiomarina halalkaliphila TaxID=2593535 RepID=A0A552X5Z9_9GAMM|nr:DUF2784 family protein [Aliidiomarina halalkaliphila]